ncbi:MAG: WD40 repeat domain-containing protein [Rhodopirellula sp.]|nr:WD40 repeat domain-containing protein [Rhodopirellula sp.]
MASGLRTVLRGHAKPVRGVAFSPDGHRIATCATDGIRLWSVAAGCEIWSRPEEPGLRVVFSADGRWVVSAEKEIRIYSAETGEVLSVFAGHKEFVNSLAISPDKTRIASGSGGSGEYGFVGDGDSRLRIWELSTGEWASYRDWNPMTAVYALAFSPDGHQLAIGSSDGIVRLLDLRLQEVVLTLRGHESEITNVVFSPDGRRIATASGQHDPHLCGSHVDNTVRIWDAETGVQSAVLRGHENTVSSLAFWPAGAEVLSGSWDHTVRLWAVERGELLAIGGTRHRGDSVVNTETLADLAFSSDGTVVAIPCTGLGANTVCLWDFSSLRNSDFSA